MRWIEVKPIQSGTGMLYAEIAGKSTENKPTENLVAGSLFMETDTGDVYVFEEESSTWTKIGG